MGRDVLHNTHLMRVRERLSEHSTGPEEYIPQQQRHWSQPVHETASPLPAIDQPHYLERSLLDGELEMELEASDNTLRRHEEAVMRVSEHQNPFSSSKLQPFHQMSEQSVDTAIRLYRSRVERQKQFLNACQAANLKSKSTWSAIHTSSSSIHNSSAIDDQWKLVKEHADIRVFRHAQRRGKTTSMMAQGMIRGSLAETMDGLYAETTKEARVLYSLLSDKFLDASVLHVDSYRTAQHPFQFAGVTWMAMETPSGYGVCKNRDFLCFKKMGTIRDPDHSGDDVGFLTLLSVDQSEAASSHFLRASSKTNATNPDFVRGFLSLTVFFKPMENGLLSMFVQGDFNARGHLTARLADALFADLVFALGNAAKCGQAKSLAMLLQSIRISAGGQLPWSGVTGSHSTGAESQYQCVAPALRADRTRGHKAAAARDRCGVCSKTLWKMLATPEFCRSCWTRTCRTCRVTMPIYCADFHRAHDEDGADAQSHYSYYPFGQKNYRRLPRPCKETFCLKCVCSVLPHGVKMNAKLLKQTAKKTQRTAATNGPGKRRATVDPSPLRRGPGSASVPPSRRVYAPPHHGYHGYPPSSVASRSGKSHRHASRSGGSRSSGGGREPGKVYVHMPLRSHQVHHQYHHHHRSRGGSSVAGVGAAAALVPVAGPHFDDHHSSISVLSSAESEKLQRQRLSLGKPAAAPKPHSSHPPPPSSMLEVLENFQLDALSARDSDQGGGVFSVGGHSFQSYSSGSGDGAPISFYPVGGIQPPHALPQSHRPQSPLQQQPLSATARKLQLLVNLPPPRKRTWRSCSSRASSSRNGRGDGEGGRGRGERGDGGGEDSGYGSVFGGDDYSCNSSKLTNYAPSSSAHKQSPHGTRGTETQGTGAPLGDEYYTQVLQRYLEMRRTSLGLTSSSTMSTADHHADAAAAATAAAASAAAASGSSGAASGRGGGEEGGGGGGGGTRKGRERRGERERDGGRRPSSDSRKMRILRDLQPRAAFHDSPAAVAPAVAPISALSAMPYPYFDDDDHRSLLPLRLSLSSLVSADSLSSAGGYDVMRSSPLSHSSSEHSHSHRHSVGSDYWAPPAF